MAINAAKHHASVAGLTGFVAQINFELGIFPNALFIKKHAV
jgi:hypothetical protein